MNDKLQSIELTEHQISELLELLELWDREEYFLSSEEERRKEQRFPFKLKLAAVLEAIDKHGQGVKYEVCVRNISAGGICFIHRHPLELGQDISLTFPALEKEIFKGLVTHQRPLLDTVYEYGVTLHVPINISVFQPHLEPAYQWGM